jgi:hypothetical protein
MVFKHKPFFGGNWKNGCYNRWQQHYHYPKILLNAVLLAGTTGSMNTNLNMCQCKKLRRYSNFLMDEELYLQGSGTDVATTWNGNNNLVSGAANAGAAKYQYIKAIWDKY